MEIPKKEVKISKEYIMIACSFLIFVILVFTILNPSALNQRELMQNIEKFVSFFSLKPNVKILDINITDTQLSLFIKNENSLTISNFTILLYGNLTNKTYFIDQKLGPYQTTQINISYNKTELGNINLGCLIWA